MTKPGTILWKMVRSKKPLRARWTNDAVVCGACRTSSLIEKLPQFVWMVTS
jgi:hypothetical protein